MTIFFLVPVRIREKLTSRQPPGLEYLFSQQVDKNYLIYIYKNGVSETEKLGSKRELGGGGGPRLQKTSTYLEGPQGRDDILSRFFFVFSCLFAKSFFFLINILNLPWGKKNIIILTT